jgi:hypothetical protein
LAVLALAALAFAASAPSPVAGQPAPAPGEIPLADVIEILLLDRQLIAVDARGGGQTVAPLRRAEQVLWTGARGVVGVVMTNERLLAVSADSAAWQETGWQRGEAPPDGALLGERVALIVTTRRAIGFDGGSGNLVESVLGPRERLLERRVGENVAVVVTDRRALGLSPFAGGFFEVKLDLGDPVKEVAAHANLVTLTTDHRLLIFRAPTGSWEERRLGLQ